MIPLSALATEVIAIARQAGQAILEVYYETAEVAVEHKADNSPLTLADRRANQIICEGLERLATVFPILSEENKTIPYADRKDYDYYWLVDPLDGTKEFIKRNGEFTVNIALVHQQRSVMGVVYAPDLDEMYWAARGQGAFRHQNGVDTRLQAKEFQLDDEGLRLVCSRSHLIEATQAFVDRFRQPELVASGSSLKFLLIATGRADIYPRLAPTMEWDTGAAQIVLEEAGGQVLNDEDQQPLRYNKEYLLNPHFVAYGRQRPAK